jgi:hypothetical protein
VNLASAIAIATTVVTLIYNGNTGTNTMVSRVLTPDANDTYSITKSAGVVTMTAPTGNMSTNLRKAFWPSGLVNLVNSRVCATWITRSAPSVQEGIAHHITVLPDRVRAITVTKNIVFDVFWVFNVHTWDTTRNPAFEQLSQFDMSSVIFRPDGSYQPLPWRVCTQMRSATLTFKVWFPAVMKEPSWTDPAYTRTATLPADWLTAGKSGWYVGHIPPGGRAQYNNLGIWSVT